MGHDVGEVPHECLPTFLRKIREFDTDMVGSLWHRFNIDDFTVHFHKRLSDEHG